MSQTLIEKIAGRFAVGIDDPAAVRSGDFISIRPAHVMTHDNTGAVIPKFKSIGAKTIANPRQPVFALDHNVQDSSDANKKKYAAIEAFAVEMGVDFYPAGRGIGHQIMVEEGYIFPGTMVVASDSHSNMYGGLGCLGTPVVRTDAAALWATGRTWWQVPPVTKVELTGSLPVGSTGKDVIIVLAAYLNHDEVLNDVLEFSGDGIAQLTIEQRLTIANMTTEWGALAGVFPVDEVTIDWLLRRMDFLENRGKAGVPSDVEWTTTHPRLNRERINDLKNGWWSADSDAVYVKTITLDLSTVQPHISGPDTVKIAKALNIAEEEKIVIQKAYLVSCVNSRLEDIAAAAAVIRGKKVAPQVEFYIAAASAEVQQAAEASGDWQILVEAGAKVLLPGCGPCIGLGRGLLQDGETGISATNRNFKGRMGSKNARAYLASPAVVAASAVNGYISAPQSSAATNLKFTFTARSDSHHAAAGGEVNILEGFSEKLSGELIFCDADNLNTDGIYPGKYTYNDEMTPEQQADVVMENYDPQFGKRVNRGDILAGGFNFGTGSSREQAATALKYRGIQLVIAGSFSETYKRNALNNGFLPLEIPGLIHSLRKAFPEKILTRKTGFTVTLDIKKSQLSCPLGVFRFAPVGAAAQELILAGGLENWVSQQLTDN